MKAALRLSYLLLVLVNPVWAFPPAPYYTIYGTVRDQVGQGITAEGAVLVLLKGDKEIGRTPIGAGGRLDQNYELNVRLDANRSGTTLYTDKAVATQGLYSLVVEMNGAQFLPIEVAGTLSAGKGGERVRLDLNLGEDTDRDGMPDIWEQWQLYQAGKTPDAAGNWPIVLINKDGDFDGDGQSNFLEYIAGTFAGDATETFGLTIKEKLAANVRFEFYAITGKTYTIECSEDMKAWVRVPFASEATTAAASSYSATEVGIRSAFTAANANPKAFYRLTVR
jgi:hypothetical protein